MSAWLAPASITGRRAVITRSWARSADCQLHPDHELAPLVMTSDEAQQRWRRHPLGACEPLLRDVFADVVLEAQEIVTVCDRDGTMLWRWGHPRTLEAASELHGEPGSNWSELSIGTNAMGTALAERHPLQVLGTEHFSERLHGWACSAAPVHQPGTGEVAGVVNLSGAAHSLTPHSLALVTAAARMLEARLSSVGPVAAAPRDGLRLLGGGRATLRAGGRLTELSLRHAEILALLAAYRPEGWTAEQLAIELHGDFGKPVSVRVELSRLRRRLGPVIEAQPYRLADGVAVDVRELEALLAADRIHAALDLYRGPLLPGSEVPLINELRDSVEAELRARVLDSNEPTVIERWLRTVSGHEDGDAIVRLLELCDDPAISARYRARIDRLNTLGLMDHQMEDDR